MEESLPDTRVVEVQRVPEIMLPLKANVDRYRDDGDEDVLGVVLHGGKPVRALWELD